MIPRRCKHCERTFVKTEHLKRHQRSHTGEKPYKCSECAKCFSRSDVLSRHLKAHFQQDVVITTPNGTIDEEEETRSTDEQEETNNAQERSDPALHQPNHEEPTVTAIVKGSIHLPESEPSHVLPSLHSVIPNTQQDPDHLHTTTQMEESRQHFSRASNQHSNWSDEDMEMAGLLMQTPGLYPGEQVVGVALPNHLDQSRLLNRQSTGEINDIPGGNPTPNDAQNFLRPWLTPADTSFAIPDEFQFWLNNLDRDSQILANDVLISNQSVTTNEIPRIGSLSQNNSAEVQTPSEGLDLVDSVVPKERFLKVQQLWPHRSAGRRRMMHTLWRDVCHNTSENLFCEVSSAFNHVERPSNGHSRRGLDDEVRDRLEQIFGKPQPIQEIRNGSVASGASRSEYSDREHRSSSISSDPAKFPPAEILDVGLDLYFRHFHPLYQFVHLPTFHPRTANSSLLQVMCLIGLTLINSRGANNFVHRQFTTIFDVVEAELSSFTTNTKIRANQFLTTMASGILVVALAEILGGKIDQTKIQRLHVQILTQCYEQRLFAAGYSEPLNDATFESFQDLNSRWKAWSRVESAKRLLMTMLLVDTWAAGTQSHCPILRTTNLQFLLPCDTVLFQCKSAARWLDLMNKGHQVFMPLVALSTQQASIPRIMRPIDALGMQGILSLIRLRIFEDYHRLISGSEDDTTETSLVPWQTFAADSSAQMTQELVLEVMNVYGDTLRQMNPNCTALWHNTCIMLTADLRTFELGAGCAGPIVARQALAKIAVWAQTSAARRAILHAAQTFKIMSGRRVSDGDPFHLCYGLFLSALVLALYILMIPPKDVEDDGNSFELLDEVDWHRVGRTGIAFGADYVDEPAVSFIHSGGSISLDGVVHHGGYQSARRILVDFVQLLDDVGKWRAGRYTHILMIMSDALVDDDVLEFHS